MPNKDSRIARIALIGLMAFTLVVGSSLQAAADERPAEGLTDGDAGDTGTSAFVVPPTGYVVTFFFPGATTVFGSVATSVHCTNISTVTTPTRVEFYNFAGALVGVGNLNLLAYRTATLTAGQPFGSTSLYVDDVNVPLSSPLNQGVVRVLKKGTGRIICTAQVLDAVNVPPAFVTPLPHFGPTGLH